MTRELGGDTAPLQYAARQSRWEGTTGMVQTELTSEDDRTPEEQAVRGEAVVGLRGRVPAPMIAWLKNPKLARRGQQLGELLRYQTTLEPRLSELTILVTARHRIAHYEWTVHEREDLKAGLHS